MTLSIAQTIMSDTRGHVCLNLKEKNFGTLFSVVADLNTLDINRAEGQPNRAKYVSDRRLIDTVLK
ncbi:hypothetical protein ACQCVC_17410 [Bacillus altitudinis]